jgi:hypothetical protein
MLASRPQNESLSTVNPSSAGNVGGHGSGETGRLRQPQQQRTRPAKSAQLRGWRWTLAALFVASLVLAGWVWFQLLHSVP